MSPRLQRGAIAVVQVLALAVWFSMSAVVPSLREEWGISAAAAVWLTGAVQLGFVTGALTFTALNLADRLPPHLLLATSAAAAAGCTVLLALTVDGMAGAVPAALPHRLLPGRCVPGRDEADGVLVGPVRARPRARHPVADPRYVGTALSAQTAIGVRPHRPQHPARPAARGHRRLAVRLPPARPRPGARGGRHARARLPGRHLPRPAGYGLTGSDEHGCAPRSTSRRTPS
jgi:hypothetical protein